MRLLVGKYIKSLHKVYAILFLSVLLISCKSEQYIHTDIRKSTQAVGANPDPEIVALIAPYKDQIDSEMNEVIGTAEKQLVNDTYQSTLGNFVTDLILRQGTEAYGDRPDFALVTNGGLRTPINEGDISLRNIFELMPFENELVVVKLKGSTVQKLFEHAAIVGNTQMANVRYVINKKKPKSIFIAGEPLDTDKEYTLVVSDYLANGGDEFTFMQEAIDYEILGLMFRDAIVEYIKELTASGKQVTANLDDRVTLEMP